MAAEHIFIDTNVFLAFYAYTKDDVEALKIVSELAKAKKLILHVPDQVVYEFERNREAKIAESTREFEKGGKSPGVPRYMSAYNEAKEYSEASKGLQRARDALLKKARADAESRQLAADRTFDNLIAEANLIITTSEIIEAAKKRRIVGNPPGKKESHGDQINWEALLAGVPEGSDLHVISKDGDFASPLSATQPHYFLKTEWSRAKTGTLYLHEELRPFLNSHFPSVNLATDVERHAAVDSLENSAAFATTHAAIAKLEALFDALTWSDADRILTAGETNRQISWIGSDSDVSRFYLRLIEKFENKIDAKRVVDLREAFKIAV
ncbi:hypothetical protein GCM10022253_06850 [Sphingomonas endophytica]|uniref:Nucleic acid-binding protein n=1 Tax=Sphingomonas endophytica TaxID=869719 RepID=A0ABR6N2S1_9SPHN|nr:PIN domain-containing protein [Sphingomonas endophytica]MBB5724376.1 putative nucleic acid-binding protein [Sphingomonas endophytica]